MTRTAFPLPIADPLSTPDAQAAALSSHAAPDDPSAPAPTIRQRSESVRAKADGLLVRSAELVERSRTLRHRLGRPDWGDVAVLNVEDHEPARFLRTRILENAGYTVCETESAAEAVEASLDDQRQIRLVLLDVGLPDGDGFEVCEQIKSQRADVPVVLITSIYRSASDRRHALDRGADGYLLEPLPRHRLIGTIDRLLTGDASASAPAVITTDNFGNIVALSATAARLLNLSVRGALGRNLLLFVGAQRDRVGRGLQLAASGQVIQERLTLVPRERKRLEVEVDMNGSTDPTSSTVEWRIQPA